MTAALEPNIADIYRRLGLTDNALRTIATSRPQRDVYYVCKEMGQRSFSLPFGPRCLGAFARNTSEDHAAMDAILAQEGIEGFPAAWYHYLGDGEAATFLARGAYGEAAGCDL
jgi:type IV secretion system protein VirB4